MAAFNSESGEADLRTLRLSNPPLSEEVLDRFLSYQQALADFLRNSRTLEARAGAHRQALAASGIEAGDVGPVASVCAQFCAKRSTARRIAELRAGLVERIGSARAARGEAAARDLEALERIDAQRAHVEDLGPLERRYGHEEVARLVAREERLVSLHRLILAADPPITPAK